jgi:hypothetical protein
MQSTTFRILLVLIPLFCSTLLNFKMAIAKESDGGKRSGGYYDNNILEDGSAKAGPKKKKHRHKKKGSKNKNGAVQNPGAPQEDVTDQKEVSEQADQGNSKHKK